MLFVANSKIGSRRLLDFKFDVFSNVGLVGQSVVNSIYLNIFSYERICFNPFLKFICMYYESISLHV